MSSRCRPTPASSSSGWRSRTSTGSTGSRRRLPSARKTASAIRDQRSARRRRFTTTCGCCSRASGGRSAGSAGARSCVKRRRSSRGSSRELPPGTRLLLGFDVPIVDLPTRVDQRHSRGGRTARSRRQRCGIAGRQGSRLAHRNGRAGPPSDGRSGPPSAAVAAAIDELAPQGLRAAARSTNRAVAFEDVEPAALQTDRCCRSWSIAFSSTATRRRPTASASDSRTRLRPRMSKAAARRGPIDSRQSTVDGRQSAVHSPRTVDSSRRTRSSDGRRASARVQVLRALRVPALRADLRGSAAAAVLVQQPVRRLPDLPRLRQHHRARHGSRRARSDEIDPAGRHRAVEQAALSRAARRPEARGEESASCGSTCRGPS